MKIPTHYHKGTDQPKVSWKDLKDRPYHIARTAIPLDLSGAAATQIALHLETEGAQLLHAYLLYTEASSADAGVAVKIGKESDDDYYYTGTSEVSKALWYTKEITLLKDDYTAGDTIILSSAGGKTGTGEIILILEYMPYK